MKFVTGALAGILVALAAGLWVVYTAGEEPAGRIIHFPSRDGATWTPTEV